MKGLFFILFLCPLASAPPNESTYSYSSGGDSKTEGDSKTPVCDNSLSLKVLKASKGMLSMESALMVGKAGTDAVSATEDGGGAASTAHKGSIAINSAMAVHALSAYDDCTSALSECRTNCGAETADPIEQKNKQAIVINVLINLAPQAGAYQSNQLPL